MSPSPLHILLVDRDSAESSVHVEALRDVPSAANVDVAETTDDAAELLETTGYDVLLAREDLQTADGLSFLAAVAERTPEMQTILLANEVTTDLLREASAVGIDEVVPLSVAPADESTLAHRLRARLETARSSTPETRVDATTDEEPSPESDLQDPAQLLEAVARIANDGIITIDTDSTIRFVNPAIEDILGYAPSELLGESLTVLMSDRLASQHDAGFQRYLDTGERRLDWDNVELPGQHSDGTEVALSISFSEITHEGERFFTGIIRDISEQKRREQRLRQLNEGAQALSAAETVEEACNIAVRTAQDTLGLPISTIAYYDEQTGTLQPMARTVAADALTDETDLFASDRDLPWEVYLEQERRVIPDVSAASDLSASETPLQSVVLFPIGSYGVFVSGATEPRTFSQHEITLVTLFVANVRAALDRVEREEQLRERTAELEARTETLDRVNRLNSVIRDITQVLTEATTREEIEQTVCTKLANAESYRFAWIGEQETVGGRVVPRTSAGTEKGYLDDIEITADESSSAKGPTGRAVKTHESQVQNNLHSDPPFEPWRQAALQRGYRASISVPLVHDEILYGVLNLYAETPEIFDELEETVLAELGRMIGYAINALERKKMLVSETAVELEFRVTDPDIAAIEFTRETGSRFEFEALVNQTDGTLRAFFTIDGSSPDAIRAFADRSTEIRDIRLIAERESGYFYEATLNETSFFATLLGAGAHPTALTSTPDGAELLVELPSSGDIKAFLEMFLSRYDAELTARRELDRPVLTEEEFEAIYLEQLTDREEEVLRTAYHAGFFNFPRDSSGSDIAEILGISQPTVSRHIRKGEGKLFDIVFGDQPATEREP
ncbi:bacterio-opsin activator domain-containing protein [Haloarcula nitratireducens]|uniref:GAF domain-containing protein n=1 Tax=Haloarcula nitratireducens TaxID=2487749 RepID=A0AAW4P7L9_9EURY|nr:bacterio-opsin activator domain-containing protein [Halomicroarcula nitratireducens]MBX0293889.1 GAF domain-containing protein [Halomicroarcula nitratireducens]